FDFTLLITGDSPVDDDDDPYEPPVDDEDQLWSFEECERTYTDASADDLTYWSTLDSSFETHSGIEIDQNPMVDIKRVEVSREGDNLVIEIKMNGVPDLGITGSGISNIYLYLLDRDSGHLQPPLEMGNDLDMTEEDYEPTSVLATTSLYHGGSFWISEQEVIGSNYLIRGSISSLISIGVDPDFELFVKVAYTDLENFATEDSLNVRITRDYAGYGAWEVDRSLLSEDVSDQGADPFGSGNIKAIGVAVAIIVFLVVLIISIFAISRRKNRHKPDYPDRYY
ncbi:MAG: hypothetical protein U9R75_12095, partial [Candidatus Thermoplasmatota archaeon]|nr:hypothetical protein [Candidatus Thermoplasmatota archaeon]